MDHWGAVLVAKLAPGAGLELKKSRGEGIQSEPAGGKNAEAVRVSNKKGVTAGFAHTGDYSINSSGDIGSCFSVRARVGEDSPVGNGFSDLGGGEAFVIAVVPLGEVGGVFSFFGPPSEFAGAACAESGTAQNEAEMPACEKGLEPSGALLAEGSEGDVGGRGVAAGEAPLGFTVADEDDFL